MIEVVEMVFPPSDTARQTHITSDIYSLPPELPYRLATTSALPSCPIPLSAYYPQIHSQTGDHLLVLSPPTAPPFRPAQQPVGQGDDARGAVDAMILVGVLDRVGGDAAVGVKGEDEEPGELVALAQVEDRFVAAEELAEAAVEACGGGGIGGGCG
jgi:hypothetical protein